MTKILANHVSQQQEQQLSGSADLARRFEWRLQWEKSQLENRPEYHQAKVVSDKLSTDSSNQGQNKRSAERLQESQFKTFLIPSDVSLENNKLSQIQRISTTSGVVKGDGPITKDFGIANMLAATFPNSSYSSQLNSSVQQKSTQYVRTMPTVVSAQQLSPGMHIYQSEGTVEVAFRSTRLNEKEGMKLIAALKKDLASLGLVLSRLTLNGELVWHSELDEMQMRALSCSDEATVARLTD
ncbi:MAG: hypothetical protein ABW124_01060 [Candidatus Thiodiazotropha sp. 6PLUC9]